MADTEHRSSGSSSEQVSGGESSENSPIAIKVGMLGDSQIGKTTLMVKYCENTFDEDYIQTLGVLFMEKFIEVRGAEIVFAIWDLGGQREFVSMMPLVCNDAVALLFMFDLTRKATLHSVKEWYRQARGFSKTAIPILVGTKYDQFKTQSYEQQEEITKTAKRYAKAMHAPLVFCSSQNSVNIRNIFKIVLSKAFDLGCTIPEETQVGEAIIIHSDM